MSLVKQVRPLRETFTYAGHLPTTILSTNPTHPSTKKVLATTLLLSVAAAPEVGARRRAADQDPARGC